jgi:hypothetical protein
MGGSSSNLALLSRGELSKIAVVVALPVKRRLANDNTQKMDEKTV